MPSPPSGGDGSTNNGGASQPKFCFTGVYECDTGDPGQLECGEWELTVDENDAVTGSGVINRELGGETSMLILIGEYNANQQTMGIDLVADNGHGIMIFENVTSDQPTSGVFMYDHDPGSDATISLQGIIAGDPCSS